MNVPMYDPLETIREIVRGQSWYKQTAKAVAGGVGVIVSVIWLGTSMGLDIPEPVSKWVFVIIAALTTLGIYQTPSGITQHQYEEIKEAYAGRHRRV